MEKTPDNRLFIFGGCYSNLQATQRLQVIANQLGFEPHQIICTGDVVGYCAQPEETVQLIKNWGIHCIAGNVEVQLREGNPDCGCNFNEGSRCDLFSLQWFPYSQKHLSNQALEWMQTLPKNLSFEKNGKNICVLHGGYDNISEFIFASTPTQRKLEIFEQTQADIIIAGHAGLPFIQRIQKNNKEKRWINPGVIGMPANDGTTRCWYGIMDMATCSATLYPFEYDFEEAAKQMTDNNLPATYAQTLRTGIWDNCEILPRKETDAQGINLPSIIQLKKNEILCPS